MNPGVIYIYIWRIAFGGCYADHGAIRRFTGDNALGAAFISIFRQPKMLGRSKTLGFSARRWHVRRWREARYGLRAVRVGEARTRGQRGAFQRS